MPLFLFRSAAESPARHRRDLMLFVQVAGLLATAWLVWSTSLLPRLSREPIAGVVAQALSYTLLACLASAAITLSLYLFVARSFREDAIQMALRTSATAVWFAAATILLAELSPATLPAAIVLVVSTTRLLYSQWRLVHPMEPSPAAAPVPHPDLHPSPPLRFRELIPGFAASLTIQAGVLIFPMGFPILASALFCLSVAMVTLCAFTAGVYQVETPIDLPRSVLGFLLTLILAAGLTVGGLAGDLGSGSHWHSPLQRRPGPLQSARALLHRLFEDSDEAKTNQPATNLYLPPAGDMEITDNSFPGVVLLPDERPPQPPVLLAPSFSWNHTSPEATPIRPFSLPFSGEYWMYRPPYDRPPRTSHVQRGNPLMLSFRTTDHAPMFMEAYQKLDRALDPKCCRAIQVEISNMDRYPGTVALELVLVDTQSDSRPMLSLGSVGVSSRPRANSWPGSAPPASESLDFLIPATPPLHQFDGIKVIFHRDRLRLERSARVSIERFLLLPRSR